MCIQTAILTVVTSRIGDRIEEVEEEEELIEFMSGDYDKEEVEEEEGEFMSWRLRWSFAKTTKVAYYCAGRPRPAGRRSLLRHRLQLHPTIVGRPQKPRNFRS